MTSSAAGDRWDQHPMLVHAAGGPVPVEFYLKFVIWNPLAGTFDPVPGAAVRVAEQSGATLKAIQGTATTATDLQGTTGNSTNAPPGEVTFKGMIAALPSGGLTLHFELSGLQNIDWYVDGGTAHKIGTGTWSTAGWKAVDRVTPGTLKNFSGQVLGEPQKPVNFVVGMPCWLQFRYQRKHGENPAAVFPSGTRVKLIALTSANAPVDRLDIRTNAIGEHKDVLFDVEPGKPLNLLIFTRFSPAPDDTNLVMNPFDIGTEDKTVNPNDLVPEDNPGSARPFLYYDKRPLSDPSGYAFHFTGWEGEIKDVAKWIPAADTFSLCDWNVASDPPKPKIVLAEMPAAFKEQSLPAGTKIREKLALCLSLHAATTIREFHGLISALAGKRPVWKGLNLNSSKPRRLFLLTQAVGPHTEPNNNWTQAEVHCPIGILHNDKGFLVPPGDINLYRYLIFRNIVLHETAHCLMYRYSFDSVDESKWSDHCFHAFVRYRKAKNGILPYWEGWAVYFSMLLLGLRDFFKSQMSRVAALDPEYGISDVVAIGNVPYTTLDQDVSNIFSSNIFKSYAMQRGKELKGGYTSKKILERNRKLGANKGYASELCLALSLYNLTRFMVVRAKVPWTAPGPSSGNGCLPAGGWYENPVACDAVWHAIFEPFLALKDKPATQTPDTVEKLAELIKTALATDADWHKILRIFHTYYLLIAPPAITSMPSIPAAPNPQTVTVGGTGFVDVPASAGDGGMTATLAAPSSAAQGISIAVGKASEFTFTAPFPVTGNYTLKLIGRWGTFSHVISVTQ